MPNLFQKPREQAEDADESHSNPRALFIACVLVAVVVGLAVIWFVPRWQIDHSLDAKLSLDRAKQLELQDAFRKTISQIVLSLSGLIILYFTWRRAEASDKTVRIMEQGHITDRFTKAIEQLGKTDGDKPNIEVRLGAIYALERIALDSARDHWNIMEILTAYVRQNAPLDPKRPYAEDEKPRSDIQAILTVLGRRRTSQREHVIRVLDLSKSRLCGADLLGADLGSATFDESNLQRAYLKNANLRGTMLTQTNLESAWLESANLEKANLYEANLQEATLAQASLQDASLLWADLKKANLSNAKLQGAILSATCLTDTVLFETNFKDAKHLTAIQI